MGTPGFNFYLGPFCALSTIIHPSKTHVFILVVINVGVLQRPGKDIHMARGFPYKKSVHQIPAHRDLCGDIRKESVGNMVSLGKDSIPFQIKDLGILIYSLLPMIK